MNPLFPPKSVLFCVSIVFPEFVHPFKLTNFIVFVPDPVQFKVHGVVAESGFKPASRSLLPEVCAFPCKSNTPPTVRVFPDANKIFLPPISLLSSGTFLFAVKLFVTVLSPYIFTFLWISIFAKVLLPLI